MRCLRGDDLAVTLHRLVERESAGERYHQALQLLGGYPQCDAELVEHAKASVVQASATQLKARVAGSEVEAAIHDPRWLAAKTLAKRGKTAKM